MILISLCRPVDVGGRRQDNQARLDESFCRLVTKALSFILHFCVTFTIVVFRQEGGRVTQLGAPKLQYCQAFYLKYTCISSSYFYDLVTPCSGLPISVPRLKLSLYYVCAKSESWILGFPFF